MNFLGTLSGYVKGWISNMYNQPINWDWTTDYAAVRKPGPGVAKSWETSADGITWTFHLRDDVRWHDGEPFTSADIKATYDWYIDSGEYRPPGSAQIRPVAKSVAAPDPHTLVITLKAPNPVFLHNVATAWAPIAPKHLMDQYPEEGFKYFRTNAVGTGPWKWLPDDYEAGISFRQVRNDDYWDEGLPYLDHIQWYVIKDKASDIAAFETKRIDDSSRASVKQVAAILKAHPGELNKVQESTVWPTMVTYNPHKEPFNNPKVIQALYLFMDRQEWVDKVAEGAGYLAEMINPVGFDYGTPYADLVKNNLAYKPDKTEARERALELMAEAGWADPSGLEMRVITDNRASITALVHAAALREMGFNAELVVKDRMARLLTETNLDFEVGTTGAPAPYLGPPDYNINRIVNTDGNRHTINYRTPEMDDLLHRMNTTIDPVGRAQVFADMDAYFQSGVWPQHVMYWRESLTVRWNYVFGRKYVTRFDDYHDRTWLGPDAPGRK